MTNAARPALTIRHRQDTELAACAAALIDVHGTDGYPVEGVADPRAWLMPDGLIQAWVAVMPQIVGHVSITEPRGEDVVRIWAEHDEAQDHPVAILGRLFVIKAARGKTAGEKLTRAAMDEAAQRGLRLVLDVMTKDQAAIRLYERLGWTRIGQATHHYGDNQQADAYCYVSPIPHTTAQQPAQPA